MEFTYNNLEYNKRDLPENVVIQIVSNSYDEIKSQSEEYTNKTEVLKYAELAGQTGSCPVVGRDELRKVIDIPRNKIEGFKARTAQIGSAVSKSRIENTSEEDALFQIVNGTIANVAVEYDEESIKNLLSKGVLPLIAKKEIKEDTFIVILGVKTAILNGIDKLDAYEITSDLVPIEIFTPDLKIYDTSKLL